MEKATPEQLTALAALDPDKVRNDLIRCQQEHDDGWMKPGIAAPYGQPALCGVCEHALECGLFWAALHTLAD